MTDLSSNVEQKYLLTNQPDYFYRRCAQFVITFLALIAFGTFHQYGASFVELRHTDDLFGKIASLVSSLQIFTYFDVRHFLNVIFGLLGLWGTWRVGRMIGGGFVGLAAMLLLAITPMYYGHMFNNPRDIPFAAGVIWSLYYMGKVFMAYPPRVRWSLIIKLALVLGVTLAIRGGGIVVFGLWFLVLCPLAWVSVREKSSKSFTQAFLLIGRIVLPVFVISFLMMTASNALLGTTPTYGLAHMPSFFLPDSAEVDVLLKGRVLSSMALPWFYVPLYFAVQLPLLHILLFVLGLSVLVETFSRLSTSRKKAIYVLLLLAPVVPVLCAIFGHVALYDAVRHFLFILPPLSVTAALVLGRILRAVYEDTEPGAGLGVRIVTGVVLSCLALMPVYSIIRLHPYEYIYYNEAFGGVKGVVGRYELDYAGATYQQGMNELADQIRNAPVSEQSGRGKPVLALCGRIADKAALLAPIVPDVIELSDDEHQADYILSAPDEICSASGQGQTVVQVSRGGVILSTIERLVK